jgi:hypothetical protein
LRLIGIALDWTSPLSIDGKSNNINMLDIRFAVAPMMDWVESL